MNNADWMVGIGGACAFLHSVVMGEACLGATPPQIHPVYSYG